MSFSVIDAETGHVLRSGQCAFRDMALQGRASGEIVIEGLHDDETTLFSFGPDGLTAGARPLRAPEPDDVDAECRRRIVAVYPIEAQLNALHESNGAAMSAWIAAVRARAREFKQTAFIPQDFADDRHWPAPPQEHP